MVPWYIAEMPSPIDFCVPPRNRYIKTEKWAFRGEARLSGDLQNISKKLSYSAGAQSIPIAEKQLESLIKNAITKGIYEQLGNDPDSKLIRIGLTLDTSLKGIPRNEKSKWLVVTPNIIRASIRKD